MVSSNHCNMLNENVVARTGHDESNDAILIGNLQSPHNQNVNGIKFDDYYTTQKDYLKATTTTTTTTMDLMQHDRWMALYGNEINDDTNNDTSFALLNPKKAKTAMISLQEQRRKFPLVVDFVRLLPRELVYEIFCYIDFFGFSICTQVSKTWRAILMNDIWPRRFISFCSAYPFNKLTPEEQRLIHHGLSLGRQQQSKSERKGTTTIVVIRAQTYERTRALVAMGNCGLHAVDLNGYLQDAEVLIRANQTTLNELSISILDSPPPSSLHAMYPLLTSVAGSNISTLRLTAPFNLSSDDGGRQGVEDNNGTTEDQQQLMPLLTEVHINGFSSVELRLDLIRFFLTRCPYIKRLTAHPIIPRTPNLEEELDDIWKLAPITMQTLIF